MTTVDVGTPPDGFQGWEMKQFRFHGFKYLPSSATNYVASPTFSVFGHQWSVILYPGGELPHVPGEDVMTSVYLNHYYDGAIKVDYHMVIKNVDNKVVESSGNSSEMNSFGLSKKPNGWGWKKFVKRSKILKSLVQGTLVIEVRMKLVEAPPQVFVPHNPFGGAMLDLFLDEETADVVFRVLDGERPKGRKTRSSISKMPHIDFCAHTLILQQCAPKLADLCGPKNDGEDVTDVYLSDVKPAVFRIMLSYVYGNKVFEEDFKIHGKDLIDASDKYEIVNLKLEAEAQYVKLTTISLENLMDNLLYAHAKNCALLKESAMDFIASNAEEVLEKELLRKAPSGLYQDLLSATFRGKKKFSKENKFSTMGVSELRKMLAEKGLEIDGSRETMIAALSDSA